jgi:hypothetical protein
MLHSRCHVLTLVLVLFFVLVCQDMSWVGILCFVFLGWFSVFGLVWFSIRGRCR